MKALALASGGIDSTVMLYEFQKNIKKVLFFDYGSKHNEAESVYVYETCKKLNLPLTFIDVKSAFKELEIVSALMKHGEEIPKHAAPEAEIQRSTVVPFRNGILISIASAHAVADELDTVLFAVHSGDAFIYPDCRSGFVHYFSKAIYEGTDHKVIVRAPYLNKRKSELVKFATVEFNVDLSKETYSCYDGNDIHCGVCAACLSRKDALGILDNTEYLQ